MLLLAANAGLDSLIKRSQESQLHSAKFLSLLGRPLGLTQHSKERGESKMNQMSGETGQAVPSARYPPAHSCRFLQHICAPCAGHPTVPCKLVCYFLIQQQSSSKPILLGVTQLLVLIDQDNLYVSRCLVRLVPKRVCSIGQRCSDKEN